MTACMQIMNRSARTIVVGDIHGCLDEFMRLLGKVGFGCDDVLVTVGDFLGRGPDSWGAARFFRYTANAFSVMGNHERRVAGVVRGRSRPAWSQLQTLSLISESEQDDWAGWLESLPAVIETPHVVITHARLDPAYSLAEQDAYFTAAVGGSSATIECREDGVPQWFTPMQFDKPVCMGHIAYDRIELVPHALYALDTGAVHGGALTAAVFPGGKIFQEPVHRNYHEEAHKAWRRSRVISAGNPLTWSLSRVAALMNRQGEDKEDFSSELTLIEQTVADLDMPEWGLRLLRLLRARFGDMPPPGPEWGGYFQTVKRAFSDCGVQNIATRILKNKVDFKDLTAAFPGVALGNVSDLLKNLEGLFATKETSQAILQAGGVLGPFTRFVKFPKIAHLPWSEGVDKRTDRLLSMSDVAACFAGREVVVTEKMDGENTSMYRDYLHARSLDSRNHPSRNWVKNLHAKMARHIPDDWRICGENLFARHAIHYHNLPSFFLVFAIYNENNACLSWDDTIECAAILGLDVVPILYRGLYDENRVKACFTGKSAFAGSAQEGYVLRPADAFPWHAHRNSIGKFVRRGHVQTPDHWMHAPTVPNELG